MLSNSNVTIKVTNRNDDVMTVLGGGRGGLGKIFRGDARPLQGLVVERPSLRSRAEDPPNVERPPGPLGAGRSTGWVCGTSFEGGHSTAPAGNLVRGYLVVEWFLEDD